MKHFFLFAFACALSGGSCFARIWRVNNNPGINADFTTLQAAHDGAASGDSIYLESSPTNYGNLECSKKLAIIGTGYFLNQNQNLQAFTLPSAAGHLTLYAGSSGSVIEGLSLDASTIVIFVSNITIRRNYFGRINGNFADNNVGLVSIYSSASNIVITQNFSVTVTNNSPSTGIMISNNFIGLGAENGDAIAYSCLQLHANTVAIIKNNIFRRGTVTVYNSNVTDNIMYNGFFAGTDNLVANNIAGSTQFGTANGNQANVSMTTVFDGTTLYDGYFKLKAGSPAIGAGYGSSAQYPIDAGMYGGSTPYILSGIPAIPTIYFMANQPVGSNSDPIDVQLKVRSNN